jgi:hypothetical protein
MFKDTLVYVLKKKRTQNSEDDAPYRTFLKTLPNFRKTQYWLYITEANSNTMLANLTLSVTQREVRTSEVWETLNLGSCNNTE